MRSGVRLGIDLGEVRIGVARCDASATLCLPVETLYRGGGQELFDLVELAEEYEPFELVVGLPRLMSGKEGKNAADARRWSRQLAKMLPKCNVRLVDERLTSVSAHQLLRQAGLNSRNDRKVIDQQAAVLILEQALQIERNTGQAPGVLVQEREG